MIKQPCFSVIIPTYNRAAFLPKTIQSVTAQAFTDWEIIIVDDGSTDDTKDVVEGIAESRLRYIFQQNAERSAARNNGIRQAKGKYICFLDSDDQYLQTHLQSIYDFLKEKEFPVAMVFT